MSIRMKNVRRKTRQTANADRHQRHDHDVVDADAEAVVSPAGAMARVSWLLNARPAGSFERSPITGIIAL